MVVKQNLLHDPSGPGVAEDARSVAGVGIPLDSSIELTGTGLVGLLLQVGNPSVDHFGRYRVLLTPG